VRLKVKGKAGIVEVWTHELDTTGREKDTRTNVRLS
jgi:hypothetical protein